MRRFIAYYRVSSEEQRRGTFTIPTQKKNVRICADAAEIIIVHEFEEAASGWTPGQRPAFERIKQLLVEDSTIEGVIVSKIDRMSRNITDGAYILEELKRRIVSADEGEIDPESPDAAMKFFMLLTFAKHYSDQLSRRVRDGNKTRAESGYLLGGSRPLGYERDTTTKPSTIRQDPTRAPLIAALFEAVLQEGFTLDQARDWTIKRGLRKRNGKHLRRSDVEYVLKNPVYCGLVRTKYGTFNGKHDPIISRELFEAVQGHFRRDATRRSAIDSPFRGLVKCGYCGSTMSLEEIRKPSGKTYRYYKCGAPSSQCRGQRYAEEKLSNLLGSVVKSITTPEPFLDELRKLAREADEIRLNNKRQRRAKILSLKARLAGIKEDTLQATEKVVKDVIDKQSYDELNRRYAAETEAIEREITEIQDESEISIDSLEELFELLKTAETRYYEQDHSERARLLRLLTSNCVVKDENIIPVFKEPFGVFAEAVERKDKWACLDSNQGPPAYQASALTS